MKQDIYLRKQLINPGLLALMVFSIFINTAVFDSIQAQTKNSRKSTRWTERDIEKLHDQLDEQHISPLLNDGASISTMASGVTGYFWDAGRYTVSSYSPFLGMSLESTRDNRHAFSTGPLDWNEDMQYWEGQSGEVVFVGLGLCSHIRITEPATMKVYPVTGSRAFRGGFQYITVEAEHERYSDECEVLYGQRQKWRGTYARSFSPGGYGAALEELERRLPSDIQGMRGSLKEAKEFIREIESSVSELRIILPQIEGLDWQKVNSAMDSEVEGLKRAKEIINKIEDGLDQHIERFDDLDSALTFGGYVGDQYFQKPERRQQLPANLAKLVEEQFATQEMYNLRQKEQSKKDLEVFKERAKAYANLVADSKEKRDAQRP